MCPAANRFRRSPERYYDAAFALKYDQNILPPVMIKLWPAVVGLGLSHMHAHNKWLVFTDVIHVLDRLNAPYNIHAGTILGFVRDRELKDSDIDIAVSSEWMKTNNAAFINAFKRAGFDYMYKTASGQLSPFGQLGQFGYEVAWTKRGVKTDVFSRLDYPDRYETGLWYHGVVYRCVTHRRGVETAVWDSLHIQVPVPYDLVLSSLYGTNWTLPFPGKWRWFEDALEVGSCYDELTVKAGAI